jgi:ribosomal protein S18 acetylase RimI-like enzyme
VRTLSTWRDAAGLYVCDLWVDGTYRGARLGEQLLAEAARAAPALGLGFMKLEVAAQNVDAMRFYRRLGFRALESDTLWVLERAAFERLGS